MDPHREFCTRPPTAPPPAPPPSCRGAGQSCIARCPFSTGRPLRSEQRAIEGGVRLDSCIRTREIYRTPDALTARGMPPKLGRRFPLSSAPRAVRTSAAPRVPYFAALSFTCLTRSHVEVIHVRLAETSAPPNSELLRIGSDERPGGCGREAGWNVSHSHVNRQSGPNQVAGREGRRCTAIRPRRQGLLASTRDDVEARPTNPLAFVKIHGERFIEIDKSASKAMRNAPSSHHSRNVTTDTLRAHRLGPGRLPCSPRSP